MSRLDVTEKIVATKVAKGITWAEVAKKVGLSKECRLIAWRSSRNSTDPSPAWASPTCNRPNR